jgi:hypothetical protein
MCCDGVTERVNGVPSIPPAKGSDHPHCVACKLAVTDLASLAHQQ